MLVLNNFVCNPNVELLNLTCFNITVKKICTIYIWNRNTPLVITFFILCFKCMIIYNSEKCI